jgi:serine phosphatase RsbU (regulator of sigma subunit)
MRCFFCFIIKSILYLQIPRIPPLNHKFFLRALIFFSVLNGISLAAQQSKVDSLESVFKIQKDEDTNKVITAYKLCAEYLYSDSRKALYFGTQGKELAEKINFKKGLASSLNNLGLVYINMGEYDKAADNFFASLKLKEELGNLNGLSSVYGHLGGVFDVQGNYEKAELYYGKSLQTALKSGDRNYIANAYQNLGVLENEKGNNDKSLEYFRKSGKLFCEDDDSLSYADDLNNIGVILQGLNNNDSALYYYQLAKGIRERNNDYLDAINSYNNLGSLMINTRDYKSALDYFNKASVVAKQLGAVPELKSTYAGLSEAYDSLRDYQQAYQYHLLFTDVKDSLFNMNSAKEVATLEIRYEQEKKEKEEELIRQSEARVRRLILIFLIAIIALVSAFSIFLFNRFRLIRRQKTVIEVKTKEIVDSINYALRLQEAILPPQKLVKQLLPDSFIFYKPKDIVAGDFYWIENIGDKVFFAAADCTGHGVPGAMVSIVCSNALTRCVKEFGIEEPGKILDKVRELVIQTFERSESEVKDGMDISLCCLEKNKFLLSFSGANNSLWLVRNSELKILEADHQPIGKFEMAKPFTTHPLQLEKGDCIYLGTDGFADQFGGEKGKKFKTANLKNLLVTNADRSCKEQMEVLQLTFDKWKGNLEQVDDVCIIGVRIN